MEWKQGQQEQQRRASVPHHGVWGSSAACHSRQCRPMVCGAAAPRVLFAWCGTRSQAGNCSVTGGKVHRHRRKPSQADVCVCVCVGGWVGSDTHAGASLAPFEPEASGPSDQGGRGVAVRKGEQFRCRCVCARACDCVCVCVSGQRSRSR
jgi:hypothetical protein